MIKTKVTELLGIEYPIFQGAMAWISDEKLTAAVSNGGGLGILAASDADADHVRKQIAVIRSLTDKPFGVNIPIISPHAAEVAALLAEERVPVVTTGAGSPAPYIPAWLEAGIKVIPVIPSAALAKKVAKAGASAVIAEGAESGGHIGDVSTMALVPQVVDAVDIPVIAAGGIVDGRQAAAAFMLGAQAVQLGTRFLVAEECGIHQNYKRRVIEAKDIDTIVCGKRFGHTVRCLKSPFSRSLAQAEYDPNLSHEEFARSSSGSLYRASVEGNEETGAFMAGQSSGLVTREQPAAEIIQEVAAETEAVLKGAGCWLG